MYRYCITGAAGFLGRALASRLKDVVGVDNHSRHGKQDLPFPIVECDLSREIPNIGAETVIHFAAINGTQTFYERPYEVLEVGCKATFNAVELARRCNARLVVASSSEVYRQEGEAGEEVPISIPSTTNPRFSYAVSKVVTEMAALHSGLEALVVRPHNIYGPGAGDKHVIPQFVARAKSCNGEFEVRGDSIRSFCFIDDFVEAMLLLLEKRARGIYHVGNPQPIRMRLLARMVLDLLGKEAEITVLKGPAGGVDFRCPDISKLRALGFSPKVSLEEGLRMTIG